MKTRFNTYDIVCGIAELQKLVGLRVNQIYDIDNKTYLIRLQGGESKTVLLIESGIRFHTTAFEWPKNIAPSGFSMKLRKHLKNKRLESLKQLGGDRIVDFQFGVGEAAYHIILELYDRGNVILTDHELTILYILRPHYEGEEVRFAVREKYPTNRAKEKGNLPCVDDMRQLIEMAAPGDNLKRLLMPLLDCGPSVIEHVLKKHNLNSCVMGGSRNDQDQITVKEVKKSGKKKKSESSTEKLRTFDVEVDLSLVMLAVKEADEILNQAMVQPSKGYIIQKQEEKPLADGDSKEYFYQNIEYHPYLFAQFDSMPYSTFDSFMLAVDEFYSTLEGQKIDVKTIQKEREALKKLSNVKKDHAKRLEDLSKTQKGDKEKAELITRNQALVDKAILAIRSAIANQMSWPDIHELVKAAQANRDPVASTIKQLKLEINHISLNLADPYNSSAFGSDAEASENDDVIPTMNVDVDLSLSAWANARKYYDQKRSAAQKEQKTIDASQKALKSAERKTQQTLKDVRTISTISKARKVYWFEKFYWFISSENYLVIGGRDAQQNELIVKRYMRASDIYVHAEIQGASSVIIRNSTDGEIPPKTLLEAGTMAISYSVAWDAKVVTNAYWVRSDQVSKTAPTGEYLGTGSFMVRGKKNFLPPCHLIMGLSMLFKLEDSFVEKHCGERKVRLFENIETEQRLKELTIENEKLAAVTEEVEVELEDCDDIENEDKLNEIHTNKLSFGELQVNTEEESTDGSEKELQFPDTQVKIEHDTGRVTVQTKSLSTHCGNSVVIDAIKKQLSSEKEDATIIPAAPSRKKLQLNSKKRKEEKDRRAQSEIKIQHQNSVNNQSSSQMKRGQKGKLKKIRSKYKDQDEEERELRMQILKSAGKDKLTHIDAKVEENIASERFNTSKRQYEPKLPSVIDDGEDLPSGADMEMLDSLTGIPLEDDELLFVIPVVAPYQALQNYKFKVKLTPGSGKRGRAAKTCLMMFSKDKGCSTREKDLLKSIKEESLARNIPGKVKLSAPQLQKFKN